MFPRNVYLKVPVHRIGYENSFLWKFVKDRYSGTKFMHEFILIEKMFS